MTESAPTKARPTLRQRISRAWTPVARKFDELRCKYPWLEPVRKTLVTIVGILLIVGGIAISWVPGPGGFIGFFGVAILASEYRWVRRATRQTEAWGHKAYLRVTGSKPRWWFRTKRKMTAKMSSGDSEPAAPRGKAAAECG